MYSLGSTNHNNYIYLYVVFIIYRCFKLACTRNNNDGRWNIDVKIESLAIFENKTMFICMFLTGMFHIVGIAWHCCIQFWVAWFGSRWGCSRSLQFFVRSIDWHTFNDLSFDLDASTCWYILTVYHCMYSNSTSNKSNIRYVQKMDRYEIIVERCTTAKPKRRACIAVVG